MTNTLIENLYWIIPSATTLAGFVTGFLFATREYRGMQPRSNVMRLASKYRRVYDIKKRDFENTSDAYERGRLRAEADAVYAKWRDLLWVMNENDEENTNE